MIRSEIIELINTEINLANSKYSAFRRTHEGYAIIKEEVDELWDEIKRSKATDANELMVNEAIQIAAMAIKFIESLYNNKKSLKNYYEFPDEE